MLLRLGAGSKTLSAIDKLIPAVDKDTSSPGTNQPSIPQPQPNESEHTRQAFVGSWRNVDANTGSITRVEIRSEGANLFAHMWGRCHPQDCDWGEAQVDVSEEAPRGILKLVWKWSFAVNSQELAVLPDGRLRVDQQNHFTDNSGRRDYDRTDYFVPSTPPSIGNSSTGPSSKEGIPASVCGDYDSCMKGAAVSLELSKWPEALAKFQEASRLNVSAGEAWAGIGNAYFQMGRYDDATRMWDKGLQLGATLSTPVCHAGMACGDTGDFLLSMKEVSFVNKKGQKEFAAAPSALTSEVGSPSALFGNGQIFAYYVQLRFSGRNYRFYYGPKSVQCRSNYICPEPGLTQQKEFANYVHETLIKMAAGVFDSQPSNP